MWPWPDRFDPHGAARRAVEAAQRAAGGKLRGATLYGSAAGGEFHPEYSDVNVAFVFSSLGATELAALHRTYRTWQRCRVVRPLLLSEETLRRSLDAYPLEYLLIRECREPLHGVDFFGPLTFEREALRLEVERVLRAQELGLGLSYVALAGTRGGAKLWALQASNAIAASASGLLHLAGEPVPRAKRVVADRCAALFGVDGEAFARLLLIRDRKRERLDAVRLLDSALKILHQLLDSAERITAPSGNV
jgi:predicted nucleotidyltransferase